MESSSTLYSTILLLGAAHGAFLAVALLTVKSGNRVALRLLAVLTLTFAIDLAINYLNVTGLLGRFPRLLFVESLAVFLYGPLLYFYVVALTSRRPWQVSWREWLHFVPFLVALALLIPYMRMADSTLVDMIYSNADVTGELGRWAIGKPIVDFLPRLLIGAYLLLGFHRLAQHGRHIREQYSLIEHISLNWLRNLLLAIGALWILYVVALAFGGHGPVENFLNIAIVAVVYALGYMGMRQPAIFTQRESSTVEAENTDAERPKYERSALDEESSKMLFDELQSLMASEHPYLNHGLTLAQLAENLGISSNYLSQIINQQTGHSFFDYINSHRVDSAKLVLTDPSRARLSILTIAMDAGFNSKSAFYAAFKRHAGITPSQYRQRSLS